MDNQNMTKYLPQVRCTPEMKEGLEVIARRGVARNISDHIRYAVEEYITRELPGWLPQTAATPADITLREPAQ